MTITLLEIDQKGDVPIQDQKVSIFTHQPDYFWVENLCSPAMIDTFCLFWFFFLIWSETYVKAWQSSWNVAFSWQRLLFTLLTGVYCLISLSRKKSSILHANLDRLNITFPNYPLNSLHFDNMVLKAMNKQHEACVGLIRERQGRGKSQKYFEANSS